MQTSRSMLRDCAPSTALAGAVCILRFRLPDTDMPYTLLYFLVIGPLALVSRAFTDPFRTRDRRRATFWRPRLARTETLTRARRP